MSNIDTSAKLAMVAEAMKQEARKHGTATVQLPRGLYLAMAYHPEVNEYNLRAARVNADVGDEEVRVLFRDFRIPPMQTRTQKPYLAKVAGPSSDFYHVLSIHWRRDLEEHVTVL